MKSFIEMQEMARKNPDQNPRVSAFKQIVNNGYTTDKYFFSFTSLKKIGIRPSSSHDTPNGIYCFPANILKDLKGNMKNVPYVDDMPYHRWKNKLWNN